MKGRVDRLWRDLRCREAVKLRAQGRAVASGFDLARPDSIAALAALDPIGRQACLAALKVEQLEQLAAGDDFRAAYGVGLDDLSDGELKRLAAGEDPHTVLRGGERGRGEQQSP